MDHPLSHIAYDMIEIRLASHVASLNGDGSTHEHCVEDRHRLRHHIAGLPFEQVCRLIDSLAEIAGTVLSVLIDRQMATDSNVTAVLLEVLRTTSDGPFLAADENALALLPRTSYSECDCTEAITSRDYLVEPPTDPGVVFDNPCWEICGEWAHNLPDGFTWQEAAWWADWHIERRWAPLWHRAGWSPDDVRHLLRKEPRDVIAVQWALTGMDPRDVLEQAYNGADPREFLARRHYYQTPDAPYAPIAWSAGRSSGSESQAA